MSTLPVVRLRGLRRTLGITKAQQRALFGLFEHSRQRKEGQSYLSFRRTITPELAGGGCIMVYFMGMWVGIETDGYTHS